MNSNHPALISGGLFFVIGLALAAALFTGTTVRASAIG